MYVIIYFDWSEDDVWFGGCEGPFENGADIKTHLEKQGYHRTDDDLVAEITQTYWRNGDTSHDRGHAVIKILKPPA